MLDTEEIRLVSAFDVSICGALWRQVQRYKRYNLVVSAAHVKWSRVMLQKILHLSSKFSSIANLIISCWSKLLSYCLVQIWLESHVIDCDIDHLITFFQVRIENYT